MLISSHSKENNGKIIQLSKFKNLSVLMWHIKGHFQMVTDARLLSINIMVYAIFNERTVNLYAHSTDFKKFGMNISCAYQHY